MLNPRRLGPANLLERSAQARHPRAEARVERPGGNLLARGARGVDVGSIPRRGKAAFRESREVGAGQSARSSAEYVFSSSRRTFSGHVTARKCENVVSGVARKIANHSAILEAAWGA